jgi:sugar lactone lactonase YvrE
MRYYRSFRFAVLVAAAAIAGCGSPQGGTIPSSASQASQMAGADTAQGAPVADAKTVLLVTDAGAGTAEILAYPSGNLLHTLTGLSEPQGVCSDGAGHFWIANTEGQNVPEYTTAGTLVQTLPDPDGFPAGCAYDPKTGNLAVTNIINGSGGTPGNVAVYTKAKGSPKVFTPTSLAEVYFAAYDATTGTLVADGINSSGTFGMVSLQGGTFKTITLKGVTIGFPGAVAWSTKIHSMNVSDQESSDIYRFDLSGKVTGTTTFDCPTTSGCDPTGVIIFRGTLLFAGSNGIYDFAYPAGGEPKRVIGKHGGFSQPVGLAISNAVTQ